MSSSVTKMTPELVSPSEPTPSGHLPLSYLDRLPHMSSFIVEVILVFGSGNQPAAKIIKAAVAKALVPYYPAAGRLTTDTDDGELWISCTGEGVWFIEASSDCSLEDVNYLQNESLMIPKEQLLPYPPGEVDEYAVPFMMQVTQFICGGFTLGIRFIHAFADGIGMGQLIGAVSEMARGLVKPTIEPVWCRDAIRSPSPKSVTPTKTTTPPRDNSDLPVNDTETRNCQIKMLCCVTDFSLDRINQIKDCFLKETGKICSVFEIVIAKLWQSRTRAIGPDLQGNTISLVFFANIRQLLHNELPSQARGYYGNCVFLLKVVATCEQVANARLFDIVRLIQEEEKTLSAKYSRSLNNEAEQEKPPPTEEPLPTTELEEPVPTEEPIPTEEPLSTVEVEQEQEQERLSFPFMYGILSLVDWRHLGFSDVNFGWGSPTYYLPVFEHRTDTGAAYLLHSPALKNGIRLLTYCVAKEHIEAFRTEMSSL